LGKFDVWTLSLPIMVFLINKNYFKNIFIY